MLMRGKILVGLLAASMMMVGAREVFGWNAWGHEVVGEIAWENMTPEARARAIELLKKHPQYGDYLINKDFKEGPEAGRATFVLSATWPDIIRTPTGKNRLYNRPSWHFTDEPVIIGDLPAGTTQPAIPSEEWHPGEEPGNLLQAYHKAIAELKDPKIPEEQKAVDLAWVEHLVGDIHQPLHAGSMFSATFPNGDKGGNDVIVNVNNHIGNLHKLWDDMLGANPGGGYEPPKLNIIDDIAKKIQQEYPPSFFTEADLKDVVIGDWAAESHKYALEVVYANGKIPFIAVAEQRGNRMTPVPVMPDEYMKVAVPVARQRAAIAGYRLAEVLNAVLAGGAATQDAPTIAVPATGPAVPDIAPAK